MKQIYFVRHAEPDFGWEDDRTRPLSETGCQDCRAVTEALRDVLVDRFVSSPYVRSYNTIKSSADGHGKGIAVDERLRERERGNLPNSWDIIRKRWSDFHYHEEGGESLAMVQRRNMAAISDLLNGGPESEVIVASTHGTSLSTILNYYDPSFGVEDFKRIIDYMPYIIRLDFEGASCVGREEILIIERVLSDRYKQNLKHHLK